MSNTKTYSVDELTKIRSEMSKYLVKDFKTILEYLGLAKHGNKDKLTDRLKNFLDEHLGPEIIIEQQEEPGEEQVIEETPQDNKSHLRQCTICKKIKLLSRFWNIKAKKGGKDTVCSKCQGKIRREKYRKMTRGE